MTPGDVVLINFPFSDLSGSKFRPAVLISSVRFADVVVCQVTTKGASGALILSDSDLAKGRLPFESYIRPERLFTASRSLIIKSVARLTPAKLNELREAVIAVIRGD